MADEYDAFTAGTQPGALRNRAQIVLLIGFLLSKLEAPLTREQLLQAVTQDGLVNYFNASESLDELLSHGNVKMDETVQPPLLSVTPQGKQAALLLEEELPRSVREKVIHAAVLIQTQARRERENHIEITRNGEGYDVTFSLQDQGSVLMQLTIFVADAAQAELVRRNFLRDPARLYSSIIAALTS